MNIQRSGAGTYYFSIFLAVTIGLFFFAGRGYAESVTSHITADSHTVHLWTFNEGKGSTFKDIVSSSSATLPQRCAWDTGRSGSALRFSGEGQPCVLKIPSPITVAGDGSLTVDTWVRVFSQGRTGQIISASPYFELEVRKENGEVSFNLRSTDADAIGARCTGRTSIVDGKWHHVAAVRDGKKKQMRLYIDGKEDASVQDPTAGHPLMLHDNVTIGSHPGGSEPLDGIIDDLRISSTVRTYTPIADDTLSMPATHYKLANEYVSCTLATDGVRVYIDSLVDRKSGLELMIPTHDIFPENIWKVSLRSMDKAAIVLLDESDPQASFSVTHREEPLEEIFEFRWKELSVGMDEGKAEVCVLVSLPHDSKMVNLQTMVDVTSDTYGVWITTFPRISNIKRFSDDGSAEYVAVPGGNGGGAGEGQLYQDPFETMHSWVRTYPCYHQSMQYNAYYGPEGGVYMATYDGMSNLKGFMVKPVSSNPQRVHYEVENYPEDCGLPGTDFYQDHVSVIGPFQGDWYDASMIYRKWALQQKWCRRGPLYQRTDIAPSIMRGSYWNLFAMPFKPPKPGQPPHLRKLARTLPEEEVLRRAREIDVDAAMTLVKQLDDYFGYPMILWCNSWFEGGGDMSPPRYLPMKGVREFSKRLAEEYPDYTFSVYIAPKRYSIQIREFDDEVMKSLERTVSQEPRISPPVPGEHGDRHAYPAWTTRFWTQYWANKSKQIAELGVGGFHIDELASATSFDAQDFDPTHPRMGGGTVYADSRRAMLNGIRLNARKVDPTFAAHHEALNEIYIDIADLSEVCTSPSNINIPMWEAVYHDYNFNMGRRIHKWNDSNLWTNEREPGDENIDEFAASFAQTFIWGNQPGWTREDIVTYSPAASRIIKTFMDARYRAMKYLNIGQMMRPLTVTSDLPRQITIWRTCDTPEHNMPAVLNSVWKAPNEASIAIVLANITDKLQTISYRYNLDECDLGANEFRVRRIDTPTPEDLDMVKGTVLERSDKVAPQSSKIIEIIPVTR